MKTAKQLIEGKLSEMGYEDEVELEYNYVCGDTGQKFETYDSEALYSPFTGSANFTHVETELEPVDDLEDLDLEDDDVDLTDIGYTSDESYPIDTGMDYYEAEGYMAPTAVPGTQKNPHKQQPLKANPVPSGSAPKAGPDADWMINQLMANPAPDTSALYGDDEAGADGYVPGPHKKTPAGTGKVPPYQVKKPGEKTV